METEEPETKRYITAEQLRYLPFDVAYAPAGGLVEVYLNYWWAVNPTKGLVFFQRNTRADAVAQCNRSEAIAKKVAEVYDPSLGIVVTHVERAYVPKSMVYSRLNGTELATDLRGKAVR
jgi:hypothetical protein